MSGEMRDALILSGILLAIVLLTHIGRHRAHLIILVLPFITCGLIGWAVLDGMKLTMPNALASLAGVVVGGLIGVGLGRSTKVEWDDKKRAAYTRAGLVYLGLWLVVLVGRLVFVYALEHSRPFLEDFGRFLVQTGIDDGGVSGFFVAMALTMVLVRTIWVWTGRVRVTREAAAGTRLAVAA